MPTNQSDDLNMGDAENFWTAEQEGSFFQTNSLKDLRPAIKPAIYALELYALTAPQGRFLHSDAIQEEVHTLAVDWNSPHKSQPRPAAPSTHGHFRFNLDFLTYKDLDTITRMHWDIPPERLDWIHSSFDCTSQSLASAANQKHRRKDGAPKSTEAHVSGDRARIPLGAMQELWSKHVARWS